MNAQNDNLDQLFRDAAQSEKAPLYDDAYWAEMNAMLDQRGNKKRGLIYWTLGGTVAAVSLLVLLFGINNQKATALYTQSELQDTQIEKITENTSSSVKTIAATEKVNAQKEESNIQTKESTIPTNSNASNTITDTKSSASNQKNNTNTPSSIERNSIVQPNKDLDQNLGENFIPNKQKTIDSANEEVDVKNEVIEENVALQESRLATESISEDEPTLTETSEETVALNEIAMLPILQRSALETSEIERLKFMDLKYNPATRIKLYAKLSGGVMENYKTSRPFESGLVDFSINIEANLKNLLIRSGLGVQMTSNADLIVSQRAKVYDFGVSSVQNDLSYQTLFDLYLPVEFGYKYKSTSFGIGIQLNYLMNTKMDLNRYENTKLTASEKIYGNTNGLNRFSTQGYLWLEQGITSRFSLGLKIGTNISGRIKEGKYFNNSATTNPIYGQISLRYNIFK